MGASHRVQARCEVLTVLVEEDCRQFGHALTERLRSLDFEMLAIGKYLALKLRVYHQIERNHTAFFAPALNVLQRMYRQGAQVILRPSVALDHDMLHLLAVGMGHAHDIVEIMVEVDVGINISQVIILPHGLQ